MILRKVLVLLVVAGPVFQTAYADDAIEMSNFAVVEHTPPSLSVKLIGLTLKEPSEEEYSTVSRMEMRFQFVNNGTKEVTGMRGRAVFRNLQGEVVSERMLTTARSIPAGGQVEVTMSSIYDDGDPVDRQVLEAGTSAEFVFTPLVVLYGDGSRYEAPVTPSSSR